MTATYLLILLPILLPSSTAVLLVLVRGREKWRQPIALVSGMFSLACATALVVATAHGAIFVLPLGAWGPRTGIVWVTDALAAIMLLVAAIVSLAALIYAPGSLAGSPTLRYFYPLHQFLMTGVNGSLITGDFFNLFVFYEIMLLSSFVLISLGGRGEQLDRVTPYVTVNLVLSALFLASVGAIYGTAGTVNMAEVAVLVAKGGLPRIFWGAITLVVVVLLVKAAVFPVFNWLPDAYPAAPGVVNALFAGLLTKVGVYTLFRVIPLVAGPVLGLVQPALIILAALTMLLGVLGALGKNTIRSILSFHIVSQVGYMIFGLFLFTPISMAAGIFHLIHNMLVKTALILSGGIAEQIGGSGKLGDVRGLARKHPWLATSFFVPAMSLAGLPPFSGFWGKWFLVVGGFEARAFGVTAVSLLVGLFTLASMLKIWNAVFWGRARNEQAETQNCHPNMLGATLGLGALTIVVGFLAAPIFTHLERVARQLLAITPYVDAVLGAGQAVAATKGS